MTGGRRPANPQSSRPVTTQVPRPVLEVTNGPLLELSVNGRQTRDELRVTRGTPLAIEAAQPGVRPPRPDRLRRLSRRRKPADGTDAVALSYRMAAEGSMWIAVRASGEWDEANNMTVSYSAPIYVVVGNESTWKRAAVPELIAHHRAQLQAPLSAQIDPQQNLETWKIATTLVERWRERGAPTQNFAWRRPTAGRGLLGRFQRSGFGGGRRPAVIGGGRRGR